MIVAFKEKPEPVTVVKQVHPDEKMSIKLVEEYLLERLRLKMRYLGDARIDDLLLYETTIFIYSIDIEHDQIKEGGRRVRVTAKPRELSPLQLLELSLKLARRCKDMEGVVDSLRATIGEKFLSGRA